MPSLTLFVTTHDLALLKKIPTHDFVKPIFLPELDIAERFRGDSLSENRLFVAKEAEQVDTEYVGVVSARFQEREPHVGGFGSIPAILENMTAASFWAPRHYAIGSKGDMDFWIQAQGGIHPGMEHVLRRVRGAIFPAPHADWGTLATGNQFIVSNQEWLNFLSNWRLGLALVEAEFGLQPQFGYRCWRCHRPKTEGYSRYSRSRHLGFFGERMTAMHFGHRALLPPTTVGFTRNYKSAVASSAPAFVKAALGPSIKWLWPITLKRFLPCLVCGT